MKEEEIVRLAIGFHAGPGYFETALHKAAETAGPREKCDGHSFVKSATKFFFPKT